MAVGQLCGKMVDSIEGLFRSHRVIFVLASCFAFGALAHLFAYTNLFPTHDALYNQCFDSLEFAHQTALGRFLLPAFVALSGSTVSLPVTAGFLSLLFLGLLSLIVIDTFRLDAVTSIAVSGIIVTNRTIVALTATYLPWLSADCFAALLAGFAFYLWSKQTEKSAEVRVCWIAGSIACLFAALALYQAMISVFLVLVAAKSVVDLAQGGEVRSAMKWGCLAIAIILLAGIFYFGAFKAIKAFLGLQVIDTYNSIDSLGKSGEGMITRLSACYGQVFDLFFGVKLVNVFPRALIRVVYACLFIAGVLVAIGLCLKNARTAGSVIVVVALLALMPFLANVCRVLNADTHDLMYLGVWFLAVVPVLILSGGGAAPSKALPKVFVVLCLMFLAFSNIQTANLAYQVKKADFDATVNLMVEVTSRIDQIDGYVEGETPVVFAGSMRDQIVHSEMQERVLPITGLRAEALNVTNDVTPYLNVGNIDRFYKNILMRKTLVKATTTEEAALYDARPSFPDKGSIWCEDGTVFVKL